MHIHFQMNLYKLQKCKTIYAIILTNYILLMHCQVKYVILKKTNGGNISFDWISSNLQYLKNKEMCFLRRTLTNLNDMSILNDRSEQLFVFRVILLLFQIGCMLQGKIRQQKQRFRTIKGILAPNSNNNLNIIDNAWYQHRGLSLLHQKFSFILVNLEVQLVELGPLDLV